MSRISIMALAVIFAMAPCEGSDPGHGVSHKVTIHASQAVVWDTVAQTKNFNGTLQSNSNNVAIVEESFIRIPILGETKAKLKATTQPKQRIDFELVQSDQLKNFAGTWILTPVDDQHTTVEVTSYVEPNLPIPRFLVNKFVAGRLRARLQKLKRLAEAAAVPTVVGASPSK